MLRDDKERKQLLEFLKDEFKEQQMIDCSLVTKGSDEEKKLKKAILKKYLSNVWKNAPDGGHYCCYYVISPDGTKAVNEYLEVLRKYDSKR